jgi:hypothetical protein
VEDVLRAVSRPHREKTMIVVLEDPTATHGDEPRIPDLGEDHQVACARSSNTDADSGAVKSSGASPADRGATR